MLDWFLPKNKLNDKGHRSALTSLMHMKDDIIRINENCAKLIYLMRKTMKDTIGRIFTRGKHNLDKFVDESTSKGLKTIANAFKTYFVEARTKLESPCHPNYS